MNTISKTLSAVVIAAITLLSFRSLPDRANFSGEWKLDESKSDLGQFANYAPRVIKITQTADSVTISKTAPGMNGDDATYTETLSYDGTPTKSTLYGTSTRTAPQNGLMMDKRLRSLTTLCLILTGKTQK